MLAAVLGVLRDAGSSIWVLGDAGSSTRGYRVTPCTGGAGQRWQQLLGALSDAGSRTGAVG
jgi:hypothetical protein